MDAELFKYFMDQTNTQLAQIKAQLDDLQKFKIEMVASARLTAFLVSGACGFITLVASVALAYYTARPPHG